MSDKNVGKIVGVYQISELMPYRHRDGHAMYKGICIECGFVRFGKLDDLKDANQCRHIGIDGKYRHSTIWENNRIGKIFRGMKRRCYNENDKSYQWYGAKGIKICDEWMTNPKLFEDWSLSHGYSDDLTIDRIYEDKDYSPDNCRWIPNITNAKYKSTTSYICVNGVTHSGTDWSKILGFGSTLINKYVNKYGLDNTIIFIDKYMNNPNLIPKSNQSYYDLYMG